MKRNFWWNTSEECWQRSPYMLKEHSVTCDGYVATVVVIPITKKDSDEDLGFYKSGVRIEEISSRDQRNSEIANYYVPGRTYFYKYSTEKVSETTCWNFRQTNVGKLVCVGIMPEMYKPTSRFAGVPLDKHPLQPILSKLVALAEESYATWLDSKRQAA